MVDFIAGLKLLEIDISVAVARQQRLFLEELLHWNKKVNLTSIRNLDEGVEKHLIDSLALLPDLANCASLLDLGSGGGLPGIPLAIALSELAITSVDSVGKKINFQKHIKRKFLLHNLQPVQARVEELVPLLGSDRRFSAVVARAFSSLESICSFAAPWLESSGLLLVMKGPEGWDEYAAAEAQVLATGFSLDVCRSYKLPFSGAERLLLILKKRPN